MQSGYGIWILHVVRVKLLSIFSSQNLGFGNWMGESNKFEEIDLIRCFVSRMNSSLGKFWGTAEIVHGHVEVSWSSVFHFSFFSGSL